MSTLKNIYGTPEKYMRAMREGPAPADCRSVPTETLKCLAALLECLENRGPNDVCPECGGAFATAHDSDCELVALKGILEGLLK